MKGNSMKKITAYMLPFLLLFMSLTACGGYAGREETDTIKIVSTIFPSYDWVREILGEEADHADLSLLVKNGEDLHSYQPSVEDIVTISDCDLFLYVGGESDAWVEDALSASDQPDRIAIDLLQVLSLDNDKEADEHVWLSLKNAKILCAYIAEQLARLDPERAPIYKDNLTAYTKRLDTLDVQYRETVEKAKQDTLVFADRFPFQYLFDDYELGCLAAFAGCAAETEVNFDTVITLAQQLDTLEQSFVLVSETSDKSLAQTIIQSTTEKDQEILVLNSIQSVTEDQIEAGITYLSIMENNLTVLQRALG